MRATALALVLVCCLAARVPAQTSSAAASPPAFTATAELEQFAPKATPATRLKLYQSYFASADMGPAASALLGRFFPADLAAAAASARTDLASRTIKAGKSPPTGTKKAAGTGSGAATERYTADLRGFEVFLRALAEQPESASLYYAALPFGVPGNPALDLPELTPRAAAVLKPLAEAMKAKMTAGGRRIVMTALARWPLQTGWRAEELQLLRDCALAFFDSSVSLFATVESAYGLSDKPEWGVVQAQKPTDDEYAYLLTGLLRFAKDAGVSERVTDLVPRGGKGWEAAKATVLALRESAVPRTRAVANLLAFLSAGKPTEATGAAVPMQSVATTADDWVAFTAYRLAAARGEKPSNEALLAMLDPKRPSLAAAAIEDRWAADYLDEDKLMAYVDPSLVGTDPFEASALRVLLPLSKAPSERHFIPPMYALIHLGRAKYLEQIAVLIDAPISSVRELMAQTLLRFADTKFYGFFVRRLYDENQNVRALCIQGLGAIRDSRAVDPLSKILNDTTESEWIRVLCAQALGSIGDRRSIQILTSYLLVPRTQGSGDLSARIYAAQYLGRQKEKTAVTALIANIDPAVENQLNYVCLEALGRISDPAGFARLLPLFAKAWKLWLEAGDGRGEDNFYAALWALFLYKSDALAAICAEAFTTSSAQYSDGAFAAAYYLSRNARPQKPEWQSYCAAHREEFFADDWRVYEFAVLLENAWDLETLLFVGGRLERFDSATQSWLLSGMIKLPSLAFIPFLPKVRDSEDESVRGWTAHLATAVARLLPQPKTEEGLAQAGELAALLDGWRQGETKETITSWLASARAVVATYRK